MKEPEKKALQYCQYTSGSWKQCDAGVIAERSVSLTVNGKVWLTLQCTPIDLEALAVGFLYNEGFIHTAEEIRLVEVCANGENVDVWLNHKADPPKQWRRTSGCTGGMTATDASIQAPVLTDSFYLPPEQVCTLIRLLLDAQGLHREVGGVHASALSDGEHLLVVAEDIGRHNTLDKISGHCLLDPIEPPHPVLLTTGRVSSEMLQKAGRIGAQVVISRTSPTSLSIQMAEQQGITLIGYARHDRFNVYTQPGRVLMDTTCACTEASSSSLAP